MKRNRILILSAIAVVILALLACDTGNLIALNRPTVTRTRTLRPTFTPRPAASPTPEDTPTPKATATEAASPTPTKRATATTAPRPAATKSPTAPPAPQFLFKVRNNDGSHGKCETGAPVFQVKGRIADARDYVAGIHIVLLGADGKIVAQMDSWGREQMNPEWGVSCFEEKNMYNYQLDATAGRGNEPMKLFLTRSATDLTPISPPQTLTFGEKGGRWYVDFYQ